MGRLQGHVAKNVQVDVVRCAGRFRPNGSSAIDNTLNEGVGYSVAWVSTGLFRVTFQRIGYKLVEVGATLMQATPGDQYARVGAYVVANRTLDIKNWDVSAAAVADLASDADTWISFWAAWQDTRTKKR